MTNDCTSRQTRLESNTDGRANFYYNMSEQDRHGTLHDYDSMTLFQSASSLERTLGVEGYSSRVGSKLILHDTVLATIFIL